MAGNKVRSLYTVTFDPGGAHELVLVSIGDWMNDDFSGLDAQQGSEDGDYIEADDSEPLARGNTKRKLQFTAHKAHASAAAARDFCFSADAAIPENYRATVRVQVSGGSTWTLSNCLFESWNFVPRRINHLETENSYTLKCGAVTLGSAGPSGPDPVGLDGGLLNVTGASGTLDAGDNAADHEEAVETWANNGTGEDLVNTTGGEQPVMLRRNGLFLPGTAGNYAGINDHAAVDLAANFMIRVKCWLPSYRPASAVALASKWTEAGDQRSWRLLLNTDGTLTIEVSTDGTAGTIWSRTSTLALPLASWDFLGIEVRRSVNDLDLLLFYSPDIDSLSVPFGDRISYATAAAPFNSTANVILGGSEGGTEDLMHGVFWEYVWRQNTVNPSAEAGTIRFWSAEDSAATQAPWELGTAALLITAFIARAGTNPARMVFAPVLRFDGTDDSLAMAAPAKLNAVSGVTLAWHGTLNTVAGLQTLFYAADNANGIRVLLGANGQDVELHVTREDGEPVSVTSFANVFTAYLPKLVIAVIDYASGIATIYLDGVPKVSGILTSSGVTSATDSTETRIMAGNGGSTPAQGEVNHVYLSDKVTSFADVPDLHTTILQLSR